MSGITDGVLTTQKPLLTIKVGSGGAVDQIFGPPNSNTEVRFKKSGLISHRSGPILDSVNIGKPSTAEEIDQKWEYQIQDDDGYFNQDLDPFPATLILPERRLIAVNPTAARQYRFPTATVLIEQLKSTYGADNVYAGMAWEIRWLNYSNNLGAHASFQTHTGIAIFRGDARIFSLVDATSGSPGVPNSVTTLIVLRSVNPANYTYDVYFY